MGRIYVVRHGMRLDHEEKSWGKTAARPFDPPLSANGLEQARQTGIYLKQMDITAVYASPLLRTIQTATEIVKTLDLPIHVEDGLVEWLNPKWYDFSAGMLDLEGLTADYPYLNLSYQPLVRPRYPENDETLCRDRCAFVARQLSEENEGDILLITHGACVMNTIQSLTGSREGANDKTCAVNVLRKKTLGGGWTLESSTIEHLSKSEKKVEYI
ncbi:MAG: histidine phosphatase family protein [Anaerolineales bacterium]|nr:histidine phosphatase family protein [Anaerolineales bacterium]